MNRNRYWKMESPESDTSLPLLSLLLILITFFIVLTRFVEPDPNKVKRFRRDYSHALFFVEPEQKSRPANRDSSVVDRVNDPLQSLINRMKSTGLTEILFNQFITLQEIKDLSVVSADMGLVLQLPDPIAFSDSGTILDEKGVQNLDKLMVLFKELPYGIDIKGICAEPVSTLNSLEKGIVVSQTVYRYLVASGVPPAKIRVAGRVIEKPDSPQLRVELIFRENF